MENSTEKVQETPKKQWIEPEMEVLFLEKAGTKNFDAAKSVAYDPS